MVANHVRERIVRGELREGDRLPAEATHQALLGVSRPTLREAYRILESEGLLPEREALTAQLILSLADVVATSTRYGKASAAAIAAAQILAALDRLTPDTEGGDDGDDYTRLADELRAAAVDAARGPAALRDATQS